MRLPLDDCDRNVVAAVLDISFPCSPSIIIGDLVAVTTAASLADSSSTDTAALTTATDALELLRTSEGSTNVSPMPSTSTPPMTSSYMSRTRSSSRLLSSLDSEAAAARTWASTRASKASALGLQLVPPPPSPPFVAFRLAPSEPLLLPSKAQLQNSTAASASPALAAPLNASLQLMSSGSSLSSPIRHRTSRALATSPARAQALRRAL
mmetsp:Transcript_28462/g.58240  ORF Transcript_28462/g.58240 Transcript_28462/m.58240 type:complete len:209 (-) Transcript_28462:677-1303(-)